MKLLKKKSRRSYTKKENPMGYSDQVMKKVYCDLGFEQKYTIEKNSDTQETLDKLKELWISRDKAIANINTSTGSNNAVYMYGNIDRQLPESSGENVPDIVKENTINKDDLNGYIQRELQRYREMGYGLSDVFNVLGLPKPWPDNKSIEDVTYDGNNLEIILRDSSKSEYRPDRVDGYNVDRYRVQSSRRQKRRSTDTGAKKSEEPGIGLYQRLKSAEAPKVEFVSWFPNNTVSEGLPGISESPDPVSTQLKS